MIERENKNNNESGESAEEWFKKRKENLVRQSKFSPLPTFVEKDDKPVLSESEEVIYKERKKAIATNLSNMEVLIPWLYEKAGFIEGELVSVDRSTHVERLSIVGQELHEAESLFSAILQKNNGLFAEEVLPTNDDELILRIEEASQGLTASQHDGEQLVRKNLISAWGKFCDISKEQEPENHTLPGFGLMDPTEKKELKYNEEVRNLGNKLAARWAKEICKDKPMSWEFRENALTQREVMIAVKFDLANLMFRSRLDSVSRIIDSHGLVKAQIIDLKTGQKQDKEGLRAEVDKRQKQLIQVLLEEFTASYLLNFKNLESNKGIFYLKTKQGVRRQSDRLNMMGYRYFDKNTGEFELDKFKMNNEERKEFDNWLKWYGEMMHIYEEDVRKLMKRDFWYDLSSVRLKS